MRPFTISAFTYAIAIVLMAITPFVNAGPPFVTDDPEPVDWHHWEISYAVSKTTNRAGTSIGVPLDINYGATDDLQLHVQPRYSYEKIDGDWRSGIDNTEIGAKYRFWKYEDDSSSLMIAFYPLIELPTGRSEFGPDRSKALTFLPLWIQYANSQWTLYGGAGYRINPVRDGRDSMFTGMATLYRLSQTVQIGGEIFNETSTAVGEKAQIGFNMGTVISLADDYHFLFSMGKGLRNVEATNQLSLYGALQILY